MNLEHGLTFFTILLSQLVDKGTPGISILVWLALVPVGVYSSYSLLIVVSDANVTSVVCKSNNNTWVANYPFRGAQLDCNEVGPKELCRRLGAHPLNTTSVCSRSTAPQPDGLDWESILEWMKTGVPVENPRSQVKIDLNSTQLNSTQVTYNICRKGGRRDWCSLRQLSKECSGFIQMVTHPHINPVQQGLTSVNRRERGFSLWW